MTRRRLGVALICAAGILGLSAAPATAQGDPADPGSCQPRGADRLAYSTNLDTDYNSVSVIDTKDLRVQRYIPGFRVPSNVTVLNDGSKLYVDQWFLTDANTKVVNPCTGQIVKTIPRPGGIFPLTNLSPDGRWLYLSTIQGFTIQKIDTKTDQVVHTYSTLPTGEPIGYAIPSPDGKSMWIAGLHHVYQMDLATGQLIGEPVTVGLSPEWLAVTPDGKHLLTSNFADGTDSIIDVASRRVVGTVNTGITSYPNSVSATPDGSQFWVGNLDGSVAVVDSHTGALIRTLRPGKITLDVTFSPDGRLAYVPTTPFSSPAPNANGALTAFGPMVSGNYHTGPGEIAVYDTRSLNLVKSFPTGGVPSPVVIPAGPFH